jgi:hypothetical protein
MRAICPAYLILFDLIIRIISGGGIWDVGRVTLSVGHLQGDRDDSYRVTEGKIEMSWKYLL